MAIGDSYSSGEGNPDISLNAGHDTLDGGSGNDRLKGGAGIDMTFGGPGDDIVEDPDSVNGTLTGGQGDESFASFAEWANQLG